MIDEQVIEEELAAGEAVVQGAEEVPIAPGEERANLWRNRNFNIFWAGQTFSGLGDAFAFIAIPLLVLQATGSVAQMGLATAAAGGGELVMGIFAGPIVDRLNRRKLMMLCDIVRALIYGSVPLCWALAGPQIWLIYLVMALGGMFGNLAGVAYVTAVTNLVDREEIVDAVSRLETTFGLSFILGPMLAGLVSYNLGGPAAAVGLDALSFLASLTSLLLIRFRTPQAAPRPQQKESIVQELSAGVRFLMGNRLMRAATVMLMVMTMITTGGIDLFIFHLKHNLGGDDNTVGLVLGVAAIGSVAASALVPFLRRRLGFGLSYISGTMVQSVSLIAIGLAITPLMLAPLVVTYIMGSRTCGLNTMTVRQQITPNYLLGRVTAAFWTLGSVLGPIGAAIVTAIAAQVGATTTLVGMGIVGIIVGIIALFSPVNVAHPEEQVVS